MVYRKTNMVTIDQGKLKKGWTKRGVTVISTIFFLIIEEGTFPETLSVYLVRETLLLSGKSQGILKNEACGNHV